MLDALHRFDLDVSFLVTGEVDIGQNQKSLWAVSYIEAAVEGEFLNAPLFASGLVERVGERDGAVVELISELRRKNGNREGNG